MPLHIRIELPDRPGALAAVARVVAAAGANVRTVRVLHAEEGRAVDELLVDWPDQRRPDILGHALSRCPGVVVLGLRRAVPTAGSHDVDVVLQLLDAPDRAWRTLIDALPGLMLADWAALLRRGRGTPVPAYASVRAPHSLPPLDGGPPRAHHRVDGSTSLVVVPADGLTVVVGRDAAPGFLRTEVARALALVGVTMRIQTDELRGSPFAGLPWTGSADHAGACTSI